MSYTSTYDVKVSVKDGPAVKQQSISNNNIVAANSLRFVFDHTTEQGDYGRYGWLKHQDVELVPPSLKDSAGHPIESHLAFVSVSASRYTFKDCGKDLPGIALIWNANDPCKDNEQVLLGNARVFLKQPKVAIDGSYKNFAVAVCSEMFDCTKPNGDPIVVTITYGFSVNKPVVGPGMYVDPKPPGATTDSQANASSHCSERDAVANCKSDARVNVQVSTG